MLSWRCLSNNEQSLLGTLGSSRDENVVSLFVRAQHARAKNKIKSSQINNFEFLIFLLYQEIEVYAINVQSDLQAKLYTLHIENRPFFIASRLEFGKYEDVLKTIFRLAAKRN